MGLDMYLVKKTYIGNNYKDKDKQVKIEIENVKQERVTYVVEDVAYWRKANQIHKWFVDHLNEGDDDNGKDMYASREDLQKLLDTVEKVLSASKLVKGKIQNGSRSYRDEKTGEWHRDEPIMEDGEYIEDATVAKELLPTTDGFFFGSTNYDQYYYQDLENTKKMLTEILQEPDTGADFYYSASW